MAFKDAWQLAQQLTDPKSQTLDDAIDAYDAQAAPRSADAVREGSFNINLWHQTGLKHYGVMSIIWLGGKILGGMGGAQRAQKLVESFAARRPWSKPASQAH